MPPTRKVMAIHGVSVDGNDANRGFSKPLSDQFSRWSADLGDYTLDTTEALWANLAVQFAAKLPKPFRLMGDMGWVDFIADVLTYKGTCKDKVQLLMRETLGRMGPGVVVVAHSLGSVVAMDLVLGFIADGSISPDRDRSTWPIHSLITLGSPLGIDVPMFPELGFRDRDEQLELSQPLDRPYAASAFKDFWVNIADTDDPVVGGSILASKRTYTPLSDLPGYSRLGVFDVTVNTGFSVQAHVNYWGHPLVSQYLFDAITP